MYTVRDLTGTVVAITGATAGIGRETARLLVEEGARVALGGRRVDRLDELVDELGDQNAIGVPMDVRSPADNARLQRGILEQQRAQNEVLLEMLSETEHTGRQTTWVLRFTFASLLIALFAVGLSIYIGTRESTGSTPAPQPSPSISRSAEP